MDDTYTADSCVATSSSAPPGCWWHVPPHATSLSSWSNSTSNSSWQHIPNPNSNSSGDQDDVSISTSFTNASNQSALSQTASTNDLIGDSPSDNHLWSHVLISGGRGGLHSRQDVGENFIGAASSKSLLAGAFEPPAYDYLKKMDHSWELANSAAASFNGFEKQFNGLISGNENLIDSQRSAKLSNLFSNWSLAPPINNNNNHHNHNHNADVDHHQQPTCNNNISLTSPIANHHYCHTDMNTAAPFACYGYGGHDVKLASNNHGEIGAANGLFRRSFLAGGGNGGFQTMGLNNGPVMAGENNKYCVNGMGDLSSPNSRNFADVFTFGSCLTKPSVNINEYKPILRNLNSADCRKQALQTASSKYHTTRGVGREPGIQNDGKKKRNEENLENIIKKPKQENSAASSAKPQVPKVKLSEKVTALQQIVSPFGKTDTASVLWEAISYIKFLQEQVQLLSNPYLKTGANKDPWGDLDRKEKGEVMLDLQSRGLCLVPVSCTPQVYRENSGPDYWSPAYRGCMYR